MTSIFHLWQEEPPTPGKAGTRKDSSVIRKSKREPPQLPAVRTKNIIDKNLFAPDRGTGKPLGAIATSGNTQRLQRMILLGTAILGGSRYAVLQEPAGSPGTGSRSKPREKGPIRLKLGDQLEGFSLTEIREEAVVFTKGSSTVKLSIDFSRKVEVPRRKQRPSARHKRTRRRTPRASRQEAEPSRAP